MAALNNTKPITGIAELILNLKDKIEKTSNEMNNYLEVLKDEKFIDQPNENEEDAIRRSEGIYDRLDEMIKRNRNVLENGKETVELIDNVKLRIENVVKRCENDRIHLAKESNELIDKIVELEERKMNKEIGPLQQQIDLIKQKFINKKNDWNNQRLNFEEPKRNKEKWKKQPMSRTISFNEMKQIEEWSEMKIGNTIFDSDVDNWNIGTSKFGETVINKSNLIFLIESEDGNLFGGYLNAKIDKLGNWINDSKSFLFSIKSNGRLNGMFKFDIKEPQKASYIGQKTWLFAFGSGGSKGDICIYRENNKIKSCCNQYSFDYNGIENALCGKHNFTPKRITIFQLI